MMKDMMHKMMLGEAEGEKPSKLSPQEIQAKMDVIMELMSEMAEAMGADVKSGLGDLGEVKKVSVVAPDEKSLAEGLDKAKEVLPAVSEMADEPEAKSEVVAEKKNPALEENEPDDLYSLMQKKKKKMLG